MNLKILKEALTGSLLLILQVALSDYYSVKGITPDLLLIFALYMTDRYGKYMGLITGFIIGIIMDTLSVGVMGVNALALSSITFWFGVWLERRDTKLTALSWSVTALILSFLNGFIVSVFILQDSHVFIGDYLISHILPTAFYTSAICFLWILTPRKAKSRLQSTTVRSKRIME